MKQIASPEKFLDFAAAVLGMKLGIKVLLGDNYESTLRDLAFIFLTIDVAIEKGEVESLHQACVNFMEEKASEEQGFTDQA